MCFAAPSRVLEVREGTALTECFGQLREVSLLLVSEEVMVGDYLLIQAGALPLNGSKPSAPKRRWH